jgi:methylphosphotriester-DNA--protein-cysteine methyltransferase
MRAWELHRAAPEDRLPRSVHPAVAKAARLIRDEVDVPKIDDLAKQCGLSPSRLSRLFKQQTGVSMVGYRQRQCLDRFFRIWNDDKEGGEQNLLTACLNAGFGSYPQFFRVCKQLTGLTPRQLQSPRGRTE